MNLKKLLWTNPELARNLALELTLARLLWTPLLLAALVGLCFLVDREFLERLSMAQVALLGIWVLGGLVWGAVRAGLSVRTEKSERTWDSQKLTALSAGELTIGKLLGASAHSLYIQFWCILAWVPLSILRWSIEYSERSARAIWIVPAVVVVASFAVAAGMLALSFHDGEHAKNARSTLFTFAVPLAIAGTLYGMLLNLTQVHRDTHYWAPPQEYSLEWWRVEFTHSEILLLTACLFLPWAALGAWRSMRRDLLHTDLPWAWPAFSLFAALYLQGFANHMHLEGLVGVVPLVVFGWAFLLTQDVDPMKLRQILERLRTDFRSIRLGLPLAWISLPLLALVVFVWAAGSIVGSTSTDWFAPLFLIGLGFLALRDLVLFTWISCLSRRQGLARMSLALVLHFILPLAAGITTKSANFVWPYIGQTTTPQEFRTAIAVTISMAVQALGAWIILGPALIRRLRTA